MKIQWAPAARKSLNTQLGYIAERSPGASVWYYDLVLASIRRLEDYPLSGRPGRVQGTRELVVSGTPYVAVYQFEGGAVKIVRFMHGAQQWPDTI